MLNKDKYTSPKGWKSNSPEEENASRVNKSPYIVISSNDKERKNYHSAFSLLQPDPRHTAASVGSCVLF
jgi:hypothetical protein